MANTKISELTATTSLAGTDLLPVVDVSATQTKKITTANLFRTLPDGTAAAPSLSFSSDAANGLFLSGTDTVGISTGGTERFTVDGSGNVSITGNLSVSGTTTTINSTTLTVDDKNIELGSVATPTDTTADGGGITLKGATDHTIIWTNSSDSWDFSEHVNIASGKEFQIAGTKVLDATSLGSAVVSSSLTSVGTLGSLAVTNNITVGGTVDGRDIATDGTKLDGIESGATADQTATEILNLIKTVDGSGSGLDADTLDGISGGSFLRSNADDSYSGTITANSDTSNPVLQINGDGPNFIRFASDSSGTVDADSLDLVYRTSPNTLAFERASDGTIFFSVDADDGQAIFNNNVDIGAGLDVTGNITVSGTVDGRDVATDGTKLDGIASGATANSTESIQDIVGAMVSSNSESGITVTYQDGDGTLDFSVASQTDNNFTTTLKNKLDGIESGATADQTKSDIDALGINAATLDSIDSSSFLRSDAGDQKTSGTLRFNDNVILSLGTGDDAEFFVNGSHLYLDLNSGIGNFYIRDGSTTRYTFDDNGDFTATGNVTAYSDIRLKKDIEVIPNALDKVLNLRGVNYSDIELGDRRTGVIAQELQKVMPEAVREQEGYLAVAYGNLAGVLIEAIKELKAEIDELKGGN